MYIHKIMIIILVYRIGPLCSTATCSYLCVVFVCVGVWVCVCVCVCVGGWVWVGVWVWVWVCGCGCGCGCGCVCVPHTYIQYIPMTLVGVALQSGEVLHGDGKEHITFIHSQHYSRENSTGHIIYCRNRFSCAYIHTTPYTRIQQINTAYICARGNYFHNTHVMLSVGLLTKQQTIYVHTYAMRL